MLPTVELRPVTLVDKVATLLLVLLTAPDRLTTLPCSVIISLLLLATILAKFETLLFVLAIEPVKELTSLVIPDTDTVKFERLLLVLLAVF